MLDRELCALGLSARCAQVSASMDRIFWVCPKCGRGHHWEWAAGETWSGARIEMGCDGCGVTTPMIATQARNGEDFEFELAEPLPVTPKSIQVRGEDRPWIDLTDSERIERLRDADRDVWRHFDLITSDLARRINELEMSGRFSAKGAIYALQSRLDDLCHKLEAAAKALGS